MILVLHFDQLNNYTRNITVYSKNSSQLAELLPFSAILLLLQRRFNLPQLEHIGHNSVKESIPGKPAYQQPNHPASVTLPDRGLATLCPGPEPAPRC